MGNLNEKEINVLFVDDEPGFLELAKTYLKKEEPNLKIQTTTSTKNFTKNAEKFDVIVADYLIPKMDGLELLKKLRKKGFQKPFIMFTGKGREEVAMEALNLGADRYLQKGGDPKTQFQILANAIKDEVESHGAKEALKEREKSYRCLFESSQDGIILIGAENGIIEDSNPSAQKITGYRKKELVDEKVWQIDSFKNIWGDKKDFEKFKKQSESLYLNETIKTKKGKKVPVEMVCTTYKAGAKKVIQCDIRNISKRIKAEKELIKKETRYRELFNNMENGVIVYEAIEDGKNFLIKDINNSAEEIKKLDKEKAIGKKVLQIDPEIKDSGLLNAMKRVWKTEKPEYFAHELFKNGELAGWRENYIYKLPSNELVTIIEDIKEKNKKVLELKKSFKAIKELNDGFALLNKSRKHIKANKAYSNLFGYRPQEIKGKKWSEIHGQKASKKLEKTIIPVLEKKGNWRGTLEIKKEGGGKVAVKESLTLLSDGKISIITQKPLNQSKKLKKGFNQKTFPEPYKELGRKEILQSLMENNLIKKIEITQGYLDLLKDTDINKKK